MLCPVSKKTLIFKVQYCMKYVGHNDWSTDSNLLQIKITKQALKKATQSLIVSKIYLSKQKNEDACSRCI